MIAPDAREFVYPGMPESSNYQAAFAHTFQSKSLACYNDLGCEMKRPVGSNKASRSLTGKGGKSRQILSLPILLIALLAGLCLPFQQARAQAYEGEACKDGNSEIRTLLEKGKIPGMTLHFGITGDAQRWATSFLKAEGMPPKRMPDYDVELDGDMDIHDWTCMFAAFRAFDKNQETAWAEGVEGPGIGEVLIVKLEDSSRPIKIRTGFALSDALFKANNRPRKVRIYALSPARSDATQIGLLYSDWQVLTRKEFELKDLNAWQTVQLPAHKPSETSGSFIAIEILSVYKGTKYDDTLISEVMN